MALPRILPQETGLIEGVIDTGIIAIGHFENPANKSAVGFLSEILKWKKRCKIPTSSFLGAYHITTEYIGVDRVAAHRALTNTLEVRSPAFHEDIPIQLTIDAITHANGYHIESWDGHIIALSRLYNAPIIYSIDKELMRKVKEVRVVNPIPEEKFNEYNKWLESQLRR